MGVELSVEELLWLSRLDRGPAQRVPPLIAERLLTLGLVEDGEGRLFWTDAGRQVLLDAIQRF